MDVQSFGSYHIWLHTCLTLIPLLRRKVYVDLCTYLSPRMSASFLSQNAITSSSSPLRPVINFIPDHGRSTFNVQYLMCVTNDYRFAWFGQRQKNVPQGTLLWRYLPSDLSHNCSVVKFCFALTSKVKDDQSITR